MISKHSWDINTKFDISKCRKCGLVRKYPQNDHKFPVYFDLQGGVHLTFAPPCKSENIEVQGGLF